MEVKLFIEKLVASGVVSRSLVDLPNHGVSDLQIDDVQVALGERLPSVLVAFLRVYDGANLDVIRFHPLWKIVRSEYGLAFASCPAGFVYHACPDGSVLVEDSRGSEVKQIADSLSEFVVSYLFGSRSAEFGGVGWYQELVNAGIAT
ncbi:MAG: SMI1/KNR4 family protein [Acidovorax sp.]|uniref:SMI1/KNR4 family protein n=1 Tax=Acidovorax sp. TaxID=1872122 RepID=UPI00391B1BEC